MAGASRIESMPDFGKPICNRCGGYKYVLTANGKVLRDFGKIVSQEFDLK